MGEEPYFIDEILNALENTVLKEEEKAFNQTIVYGRDTNISDLITTCKRFPMMSDYQLVMVREAQDLFRSIDELTPYIEQPQPTTVLVLAYKFKKIDKRKKIYKAISKNGLLFESKRLYDNQIPALIQQWVKKNQLQITPMSTQILLEFLGTDLGAIKNEIEKLNLILKEGETITPELIDKHIGFSKDFNNFELRKALGNGQKEKAYQIIFHFAKHPRQHPLVVTLSTLCTFFSQLLQYHGMYDHSSSHVARILGIRPYFVNEYKTAATRYPIKAVTQIIEEIRIVDLKSKGVGVGKVSEGDLLKELINKIA